MPQITQLDNDPTPNNNDLLVTVDMAAGTTKNISREQFFTGAPLPADTVDEQAIADGSVTDEKKKATTFTGEMTGGSITASYTDFASQVLPTTGAPHKYLVTSSFSINSGNQSVGREYTVAIRNGSTVIRSSRADSPANTYRTNAAVSAIITSSGDTINFSATANTVPAGSVLSNSQWTIVDLGLA